MHSSHIVLVPDLGGIPPGHWLGEWQAAMPATVRLSAHAPSARHCAAWIQGIENAVRSAGPGATLVAHGLGCLAVAQWARVSRQSVHAALMVSVPDPGHPGFPKQTQGFVPVPRSVLPFRTMLVATETDGDWQHALARADDWDASFVVVGRILDPGPVRQTWPEGWALLENLIGAPVWSGTPA
jgi:predicted alpha/beta hydrolase family esterase